jgi:RNA polymerase sigma factor (sigma-70 family)
MFIINSSCQSERLDPQKVTGADLQPIGGTRTQMSMKLVEADMLDDDRGGYMDTLISPAADPERQAYAQELRRVLEAAVDTLPESYRTVFMLRDIEGLSTSETGEGLGLGEEAVKTGLHRARAMIRRAVTHRIGGVAAEAFQFHAPRCNRVVVAVLSRMSQCS